MQALFKESKKADQVQADSGIARVPVGVDGASFESEYFCFGKDRTADAMAFIGGRGWMIVFFS